MDSIDFLQISNVNVTNVIGYEAQQETLRQVIRHSIEQGESSTVLVYGARGMGKSTLGMFYQAYFVVRCLVIIVFINL